MIRRLDSIARLGLAALLALALVMVGFGHRMVLAEPMDMTAYAMPDGTLPQLCMDGTAGQADDAAQAPCPACTLTAALLMPEAVALPPLVLRVTLVDWPTVDLVHAGGVGPRAPPARGPPAVFLI